MPDNRNLIRELRFLANVNIEKPLIDFLVGQGFDVKWVADIDKQMSDIQVCEMANRERRVLLTNDKDFGEIVFFQRKSFHGIILLRVKGQNSLEKTGLLGKLLDKYPDKITNHFVIITKEKFRIMPLEVI